MHETITQRIPAGGFSPAEQVEQTLAVVGKAARLLECAGLDRIEAALNELQQPLCTLAFAGMLCGIGLHLSEGEGGVSVAVRLEQDEVGEYETVDLSALKLLSSPEAEAGLEIRCLDVPLGRRLVETAVLPALSSESLACCQVRWQGRETEGDVAAEDIGKDRNETEGGFDEYDDFGSGGGRSGDEIGDLQF